MQCKAQTEDQELLKFIYSDFIQSEAVINQITVPMIRSWFIKVALIDPLKWRMGGATMSNKEAQLIGFARVMRVFMVSGLGFLGEHEFSKDQVENGGSDPCGDDEVSGEDAFGKDQPETRNRWDQPCEQHG